jgi:hypothetical protein
LTITILHARGYSFCKSFQYDGERLVKKDISLPRYFQLETAEADNLEQLSTLLMRLESDRSRLIIRGTATDGVDTSKPVRRKKANALSLPQEAPFVDKPISWLTLDIDKQLLPPTIDLLTQPVEAIEHLIQQLPTEFHSCSVHYQLSGSAGVTYTDRVSAHLVFWLNKPTTSTQLKEWAKAVNNKHRLIDDALFNPVQPHYTSKPSFPIGYTDPFSGRRSGLIKKSHEAVTIDYSVVEKVRHHRQIHPQEKFEGVSGYDNILARLGDGLGGAGFRSVIRSATASYAASNGREVAIATKDALKADLRSRIQAADSSDHTHEEMELRNSDAFLDALIDSAIEKFGDANAAPPYFDVVELPVDEAEDKLNQAIDSFSDKFHQYWKAGFDELLSPPCMAIKATAGLGKTSKLIARLIKKNALQLGDIHYFVPTHNLSNQLIDDLNESLDEEHFAGLLTPYTQRKSQLIAGRDKTDEDGIALCEKAALAKEVAKMGLPVSTTLCKSGKRVCQFYKTCGYQKQFGNKAFEEYLEERFPDFNEEMSEVRVMAHNHLFLNTKGRMRKPKLVIIDEAFWQTGIDETLISTNDLITVQKPISTFIAQTLVNPEAPPLLKALREAGYDEYQLAFEALEIEEEVAVKVDIKPDMPASEQGKRLSSSAYVVKAHILLKHLSAELGAVSRDESHVVRFEPDSNDKKNPKAGRLVMTSRKHVNVDSDTPIIFIDANAQKEILEQFVEEVEVVEIAAQRKATIHQFTDRSFSKTKLLSPDGELLSQVKAFIAGVASKGSTLVACTKAVKTAICGDGDTYEGAYFVNYGNLRGLNDYASFDNVIILGREQPPASGMSDQARAMWWDSEEPLRGLQDKSGNLPYVSQPRDYRGIQRGSVQVQTHPDWRAQLLLEQVREAESEQALDRLRLLRGEGKDRQVYILSNVPLNVTVDYGWSWKQYQDVLGIWRACNGDVPTKPKELMARIPEVATSQRTAERLAKELKTAKILIQNTIRKMAGN